RYLCLQVTSPTAQALRQCAMRKRTIMKREQFVDAVIASRRSLEGVTSILPSQAEAEGGCGVIGLAASVQLPGRHLLSALQQMRNRGNGKGGGIAAVGLDADFFGIRPSILTNDY